MGLNNPDSPSDFNLEVARGNIAGMVAVNKFGRATNVDNGIATDVWDQANSTADDDIWTAPTTARVHALVSGSVEDDAVGGDGARTVKVQGLTAWDAAEVSEVVDMDGATPVNTANAYVIIHRMRVMTAGVTGVNEGLITATAATDGTITASILAGGGGTHMAIYGVPAGMTAYIERVYANYNKSVGVAGALDVTLLVNFTPDDSVLGFTSLHTFGLFSAGTSALTVPFSSPKVVQGPAIIKMQAVSTVNDIDVSAGFDILLVED